MLQPTLQQAMALHQRGNLKQAEQLYRRFLQQQPGQPQATHYLGLCLFQSGQREAGYKLARKGLTARPGDPEMLGNLAQMQRMAGDLAGMEESYRALLAVQPTHPQALFSLAEMLHNRRDFKEALDLLHRLQQAHPQDLSVQMAMGSTLVSAGRPEDALAVLQAAAADPGLRAQAQHNISTALADLGRVEEAEQACDLALDADPGLAVAAWQKGLCRYDLMDFAGAEACFRQALEIDPALGLARVYLAVLLSEQGQEEQARQEAAQAPHLEAVWQAQCYRRQQEDRQGQSIPGTGFKTALLKRSYDASEPVEGLVLEFGVYTGRSLRQIAGWHAGPVFGFDSFEGLPGHWFDDVGLDDYSTSGVRPKVPDHVTLIDGWFDDSLPGFVQAQSGPVKFMNIDCDLYSSTRTIFEHLGDRLQVGSILVFDEYFGYKTWEEHEYKAFQELVAQRGLSYEYLALCPFTRQAAVRITGL
ncbi:tetratricopeptide repeat protein [Rhodovibrionaceae bacterium A322]